MTMFANAEEAVAWAIAQGRARWSQCNLVVISPLITPTLLNGILGPKMPMLLPSVMAKGDLSVMLEAAAGWSALVPMDLHEWSKDAFDQLVAFARGPRRIPILAVAYPDCFVVQAGESPAAHTKKFNRYMLLVQRAQHLHAALVSTPHELCRDAI
jgi:hypothetical protein